MPNSIGYKTHCEVCDKETKHSEEVIRDANIPPNEETCSQADVSFYMNGDSIYKITCLECGNSFEDM